MTAAFPYPHAVWPPLAGALLLAAIALYSLRRRAVPGAAALAAGSLFVAAWLLGMAFEIAAVEAGTKIAWYNVQAVMQLFVATAVTSFVLEYTYPGRWLTRRNLFLLAIPPVLLALLIAFRNGQLIFDTLEITANGRVASRSTVLGKIWLAYGIGLVGVNAAAFLWLFVRSPQHRWPVALMLIGQVAGRGLLVHNIARLPAGAALDVTVSSILLPWTTYAIALFGFRILDPVPLARAAALEQMRDAMAVFDTEWRVAALNRAAAAIAGVSHARAHRKTLHELLPAVPDLVTRAASVRQASVSAAANSPIEISLGVEPDLRRYQLAVTDLDDFRGLAVGHLLMLRDVTEERRAQARVLEQERTLAVLQERERLARELHDGVAQGLAAVHLQVKTAKVLMARGDMPEASAALDELSSITQEAQADVREYLLGAKTVMSALGAFFPTLRDYTQRFTRQYGLVVDLAVPPDLERDGLPLTQEVQLLRIIQEALSNVRKHAAAGCAQVLFERTAGQLRVVISDDGRGFDASTISGCGEGYGLDAMRERARALGGTLTVTSSAGQGTQVMVLLPDGGP